MNRQRPNVIVLMLGFAIGCSPGYGQVDVSAGTLRGTVVDPNGAAISKATVTATNLAKGTAESAQTGDDGSYNLSLLQPGEYQLAVEAPGFQKAEIKGIELSIGQSQVHDIRLSIGPVQSVVEVTAETPLIQLEQPQQANTVNQALIEGLPNTTRDFAESIYTLPGVASSNAPRSQNSAAFTGFTTSGFSIGGSNGRNNLVTIDGAENEYGDGDLRTPNISQESVQEFQVNRNAFAAEFGFTAGTAINVVTRSGSNRFHGSGYVHFLDQRTEARNFFDSTPGKPFEQHFFPGASLGGPIVKNKLFFFSSYEYRQLNTPEFRNYVNTAEAQGLSADAAQQNYLNRLLASGNPFLAGLARSLTPALAPLNNPNVVTLLQSNSGIFDDRLTSHDWIARVDYEPGSNDIVTFRFSLERYNYTNIGASGLLAPNDAANTSRNDNAILVSWNHIFTPAVVNTARAQLVPSNTTSQVAFNPTSTELSINGFGTFGQSYQNPFYLTQRRYQFDDNISWTKHGHAIKFGASYRPVDYNLTNKVWFGGEFDFFDGTVPLISLVPQALQPAVAQFNLLSGLPATGDPATNLTGLQSLALGIPVQYRQGFGNAN